MITRLRRWIAYQRALGRSMSAVYDAGYHISPGHYQRLKDEAKQPSR